MAKEDIKSAKNKIVGTLKEKAGEALDEKKLEAEGKAQKAKGHAQDAVGDIKDAVR